MDIEENPYIFLKSLKKCKNVLSSALHGLIAADSFGIPNLRMVISNNIIGGDYKFIDYYSAYGLNLPKKFDLRKNTFTEKQLLLIKSNYKINKTIIRKKQCKLLSIFPAKLNKKYKKIKNHICNQK